MVPPTLGEYDAELLRAYFDLYIGDAELVVVDSVELGV